MFHRSEFIAWRASFIDSTAENGNGIVFRTQVQAPVASIMGYWVTEWMINIRLRVSEITGSREDEVDEAALIWGVCFGV